MSDETKQEASVALATALTVAQAEFTGVGKGGENKYDKYRYATLENFVQVAKPVLAKHGLAVVTSVEEVIPVADRETKGGTVEHVVRVKISLRLLHKDGGVVETFSFGEGQDRADKAIYKAITGARKYGLASLLGLATTDDPEADETVGRDGMAKPSGMPAPKTTPQLSGDNISVPQPSGTTTNETPPVASTARTEVPPSADEPPDSRKDVALTQADGPCVDCGQSFTGPRDKAITTWIMSQRKKGKAARWSHKSLPNSTCEQAATQAAKAKS